MPKSDTYFSSTNQPKNRRGKVKPYKDMCIDVGKNKPSAKMMKAIAGIMGVEPKTIDHAFMISLYKSAIIDGDNKARELILRMRGEFPRDEVDVTTGGKPIDTHFQIEVIRHREQVDAEDNE